MVLSITPEWPLDTCNVERFELLSRHGQAVRALYTESGQTNKDVIRCQLESGVQPLMPRQAR